MMLDILVEDDINPCGASNNCPKTHLAKSCPGIIASVHPSLWLLIFEL